MMNLGGLLLVMKLGDRKAGKRLGKSMGGSFSHKTITHGANKPHNQNTHPQTKAKWFKPKITK